MLLPLSLSCSYGSASPFASSSTHDHGLPKSHQWPISSPLALPSGGSPATRARHRSILVTGGTGYIGSHTVLQMLEQAFRVVVVDSLDNASEVTRGRTATGQLRQLGEARAAQLQHSIAQGTKFQSYTVNPS